MLRGETWACRHALETILSNLKPKPGQKIAAQCGCTKSRKPRVKLAKRKQNNQPVRACYKPMLMHNTVLLIREPTKFHHQLRIHHICQQHASAPWQREYDSCTQLHDTQEAPIALSDISLMQLANPTTTLLGCECQTLLGAIEFKNPILHTQNHCKLKLPVWGTFVTDCQTQI